MGRNKKKNQTVVSAETQSDEDVVETEEVLLDAPPPAGSDNDSDDEGKKKKKEYKGKKLSRQQGAKGKKGKPDNEGEDEKDPQSVQDEELIITREYPMEVLYCPICTFPAEMCEFSGILEKCRPWLQEHAAELADAEEKGRKRRVLTEKERLQKLMDGAYSRKHVVTQRVLVEVDDKDRRRQLTIVTGMDLFGFNLKDISREWRKKFSCGVGVRESEEKHEQSRVEIQGNVSTQLGKLLETSYKIPHESVFLVRKEGNKKVQVPFYD